MRAAIAMCVAAILAAPGCAGEPDPTEPRCERAVRHMMLPAFVPPPSAEEKAIIEPLIKATIGTCRAEGLTREQAECILAVHDTASMEAVGRCPAIAARRPSWLIAPP